MVNLFVLRILLIVLMSVGITQAYYEEECGPYGFTCERNNRMRICDGTNIAGPAFICPLGTFCNEESTDVCEDAAVYLDPLLARNLRCRRNERIANPYVPGCKGYILCVPNGSRFQPIKFNCSGNTVFNGQSRTCTAPHKYKCPLTNSTRTTNVYTNKQKVTNDKRPSVHQDSPFIGRPHALECKNYKFSLTDDSVDKVTYFCPPRPIRGENLVRCTIFSNKFCVSLERDEEDQFIVDNSAPNRRPRM